MTDALCDCKMVLSEKVKVVYIGETCGMFGKGRGAYRVLVGKPERKRIFGRYRFWQTNNIEMDFKEIVDSQKWVISCLAEELLAS